MDALDKAIKDILLQFSTRLTANRKSDLDRSDLKASGEAIDSVQAEVEQLTGTKVSSLYLAFNEYVRYHDMRRKQHRTTPPVNEIEEWIKDQPNLNAVKRPNESYEKALNRMAWGITKSLRKAPPVRRRWYMKSREQDIDALYNALVQRAQEIYLDQQKQLLKHGTT